VKEAFPISIEHPDKLDLHAERMILNWGPSHPATHGTLRVILELEGETIVKCDTEIGYLHRGFEKLAEGLDYNKIVNLTDRLNYCSVFMNNVGWHLACEKMFGIEVPERATYLRTILSELARIGDHMPALGPNCVDIGAFSPMLWLWNIREEIYDVLEMVTGARMTTSFTRVGGLAQDVPDGFAEQVRAILPHVYSTMDELDALLSKNRIFNDRTRGIGALTAEEAVSYGWTGPCLRACGVAHDLRVANPYMIYGDLDFDIPIGAHGDVYDRFFVRVEECRQSCRIIEQALDKLPEGPVMSDDKTAVLPKKDAVYNEMEGLIHHFEIIMKGPRAPLGEICYDATEAANGELGFTIVSNGTGVPYRMHVRAPCFYIFAALPRLITGQMVADLTATLASINIIAGELDR
jgi:NADH dehydrogenase I D subunit